MKHMQKRLMSIFAAAVMVFCSVMPESLTAAAEETITRVIVSGIKDPFFNETPVNDPSGYQLDIPDKAEIKWAKWVYFESSLEVYNIKSVDEILCEDSFGPPPNSNSVLTLLLGVDAKEGYQFSPSLAVFKDKADSLNDQINPDYEEVMEEFDIDYPDCDKVFAYTTYVRSSHISKLVISGIQEPLRGDVPQMDIRYYSVSQGAKISAVNWYKGDDNSSSVMKKDDTFDQDKAWLYLTIEAPEGYSFSDDMEIYADGISEDKLPPRDVHVNHDADFDFIVAGIPFDIAPYEPIEKVSVSKLLVPVAGEFPVTDRLYLSSDNTNQYYISKIFWYDPAKDAPFTGTFQEGKEYHAYMIAKPQPGYCFRFTSEQSKPDVEVKVNTAVSVSATGKADNTIKPGKTVTDEMKDGEICIEAVFTAKSKTVLSKPFEFSNVREPIAEEHPVTELNMNMGMFSSYEIQLVEWLDEGERHYLADGELFEANKTYTARITVVPQYGYIFDIKKMSGTINGQKCEIQTKQVKRKDGATVECPVFCRSFTAEPFNGEDVYFTIGDSLQLTSPKITGKSGVIYTWTGNRYDRGAWKIGYEAGEYTDADTNYKGTINYKAVGGIATEPATHPKGMTKGYDGAWVDCRAWTEEEGTLEIHRFHLHARTAEISRRILMQRPKVNDKYEDIIGAVSIGDFVPWSESEEPVVIYERTTKHDTTRTMKNGDKFRAGYEYYFMFRLALPDSVLKEPLLGFYDHGLDFCEESVDYSTGVEVKDIQTFWYSPGADMIDLHTKQLEDHWLSPVLYPEDPKKCGDNLTWGYTPGLEINGEQSGRMLIFSGYGDMYDYTETQLSPWATDDYEVNKYVWTISFPQNMTQIGDYAFYQTGSLRTVQLPRYLKRIGDSAFREAAVLESIEIPYNTQSVGQDAFRDCPQLNEITFWNPEIDIYDSAETISHSGNAFTGTIVGFDDSTAQEYAEKYNRKFRSLGAKPDGMCGDHLWWYLKDGTLTIMGEGDMYDGYHFSDTNEEITALLLPEKMTGIGSYAFTDFGISTVTIPEAVTKIGTNAFNGVKNLTSVTVPKNVKSIDDGAFFNTSLSDITFLNPTTEFPDTDKVFSNTFKTDKRPNESGYVFNGTVHGYADSTAQHYAEKYDYRFEPLDTLTFTVSFDANGGSGSMESIKVNDGEKLVLPECGFTAPSGKVFKGWAITEELLNPGTELTVSSDIVVHAVWERPGRSRRGDVSGDENVDTADAMLLTRFVNDWEGITVDMDLADIDQDGIVDIRDAMILTRYVNGWEGYDEYFVTENP